MINRSIFGCVGSVKPTPLTQEQIDARNLELAFRIDSYTNEYQTRVLEGAWRGAVHEAIYIGNNTSSVPLSDTEIRCGMYNII